MKKSKLLDVFKSLSSSKVRLFNEFVDSPYHNKNQHVKKMCRYLSKCAPEFKDSKIDRKMVHKAVFGGSYNDLKMRHLSSLVLKTLEEFLVVEANSEEKVLSNIILMQEFRKLKLPKHFSASLRKTRDIREKEEKKGIAYFYNSFRIEQEIEIFDSTILGRRNETNLQNVSDELDVFYVTSKLKQICEIFAYKHLFNQDYVLKMMDEILNHLEVNRYNNPVINIYRFGFLSMTADDHESWFFKLKEELVKHQKELAMDELGDAHVMARNYAIRMINQGSVHLYIELLDLYKLALETNLLYDEKGEMSPSSFKNIVLIGLRSKQNDWVEGFIKKYSDRINPGIRDNSRKYSMARLLFAKGEYQEVIYLLNQIDYSDIFMMLDSKIVLMKTYYELGELDVLESLLESFNQLLIRKKILGYHKDVYRNTAKFIKQLINLNEYDQEEKAEIKKRITETKVLTTREWLLSKVS